jgi:hypothetical protein
MVKTPGTRIQTTPKSSTGWDLETWEEEFVIMQESGFLE